jgi:hypothetical protein
MKVRRFLVMERRRGDQSPWPERGHQSAKGWELETARGLERETKLP